MYDWASEVVDKLRPRIEGVDWSRRVSRKLAYMKGTYDTARHILSILEDIGAEIVQETGSS